jgi:phosphoglycerol transferase
MKRIFHKMLNKTKMNMTILQQAASSKQQAANILLLILLSLVFVFLLVRNNVLLYPIVMGDEYIYSKFSRLLSISDAAITIPNYLYYLTYSLTNYCGDGFLGCARILNTIFFVGSAIFIFDITRKLAPGFISVFVAVLSIIGPINVYTAVFMPESMYFFGFWFFVWRLLGLKDESKFSEWALTGLLYGCTTLIKPHALLFAPAIAAYITYLYYHRRKKSRLILLFYRLATFFAIALGTKFLVGFLCAGKYGITLFGRIYNATIGHGDAISSLNSWLLVAVRHMQNLSGHLLALTFVYGVPIFISFLIMTNQIRKETTTPLDRITAFSIFAISNLVFTTVLFSVTSANTSQFVLHLRYYDFSLPLLYIVTAGALSIKIGRYKMLCVPLALIVGTVCYTLLTKMDNFGIHLMNAPEISWIRVSQFFFVAFGIVALSALMICFIRIDFGARIYLFCVLPFFVVISFFHIDKAWQNFSVPSVYDRMGLSVKSYLSRKDRDKVVVVGPWPGMVPLFRVLFYLDSAKASWYVMPRDLPSDSLFSKLPSGKEWILIIGDRIPSNGWVSKLPIEGATLLQIQDQKIK